MNKPPKGVNPPQLEGKRTGRPIGSRVWSAAWRDMLWGYLHSEDLLAKPPTAGAALWQAFVASSKGNFWKVHDFLEGHGVIRG